jgi:predicted DNA-binding transcriptional regulator AlpA
MNEIDPQALFRFSVLGPLISRRRLPRGELQKILRELAAREYVIPGSDRRALGEKTIEGWSYRYRARGLDGSIPKVRADRGQSKLSTAVQTAILAAKRENPRRSSRQIQRLLEVAGSVARGTLSRSSLHRLLQPHGLPRPRRLGEPAGGKASLRRRLRRRALVQRRDARPARADRRSFGQELSGVALRRRFPARRPRRLLPWRNGARHRGRPQAGAPQTGRPGQAGRR